MGARLIEVMDQAEVGVAGRADLDKTSLTEGVDAPT
jgi:hypothetical protein